MNRLVDPTTRALVLCKTSSHGLYDTRIEIRPIPALKTGEVLVKINAASLNHRDLWIRKGKYPGIGFGSVLGADGVGKVVSSAEPDDPLLQKRVFLVPMRSWDNHPDAPENLASFWTLGGSKRFDLGAFAEYVVVERNEIIPAPVHLDDVHLAAWPLCGLTAWRAAIVNAEVQAGQKILITGIGGGVALIMMQICLAKGAFVYVTSGHDDKVRKAVAMGAKGGVNYKSEDWPAQFWHVLKSTIGDVEKPELDAVIDSSGGDIVAKTSQMLKAGGRFICYGMTAVHEVTFTMREVMRNQKLIGSTMGSRKDMIDATEFMTQHKIVPVVSRVLKGLEAAEDGFQALENSDHFGKIVIKMNESGSRL